MRFSEFDTTARSARENVTRYLAGGTASLLLLVGCTQEVLDTNSGRDAESTELLETQGADTTIGSTASPLIGAAAKRTRTIAAMMFDISSGPPDANNISNLLMGNGASLRRMYNEISFGLQDISVALHGPYRLPVANCLTIACCGPSSDRTGNGATVTQHIDALPMRYDHYFWVYGRIPSGANCGTWGDEGTAAMPAVYSSYASQGIVGFSQELGHNFGMTHEPVMTCPGARTMLDDTSMCTHVEYGSNLTFMGRGGRHPSAYHKHQEGWISGCNTVRVGASGTFTLVPQELPCNGVQLLQIPAPKTRPAPAEGNRQNRANTLSHYYLEMRAPYGFDAGLGPMVVVSIGADLPTSTQRGSPYLYVLDMTPESGQLNLTNGGLTAGQSFSDPDGGFTVTVTAIDMRSATVQITTNSTGGTTCADSSPFTAPGPDGSSCGALVGIPGTGGAGGQTGGGSGGVAGGAAGRGGSGGGGAAGRGGAAGGGAAGQSGSPGAGAGSGGLAGAAGQGGVAGSAGTGAGGTPASGGSSGAIAAGAPPVMGGTTAAGAAGQAGIDIGTGSDDGGCACSTPAPRSSNSPLLLSVLALLIRRRRSRAA